MFEMPRNREDASLSPRTKKRERGRRMFFALTSFLTPSPPPPTLNSPHSTLKKFQWTFLRSQFCFLKSSACFLFVIKRHLRFSICFLNFFTFHFFVAKAKKMKKQGNGRVTGEKVRQVWVQVFRFELARLIAA